MISDIGKCQTYHTINFRNIDYISAILEIYIPSHRILENMIEYSKCIQVLNDIGNLVLNLEGSLFSYINWNLELQTNEEIFFSELPTSFDDIW